MRRCPGVSVSLVLLAPGPLGRRYRVEGEATLGRDEGCGISLSGQGVSRRHARLCVDDAQATIEDLGSRNGVWLNGLRISERAALHPGDYVSVGHFLFVFEPEVEVLPEDGSGGAALIAPDAQTLTSHAPEEVALEPSSEPADAELLASLTEALGARDAAALWAAVLQGVRDRTGAAVAAILRSRGSELELLGIAPEGARAVLAVGSVERALSGVATRVLGGVVSPLRDVAGGSRAWATVTLPLSAGVHRGVLQLQFLPGEVRALGSLLRMAPVLSLALTLSHRLEEAAARLERRSRGVARREPAALLGESPAIREVERFIRRAARTPSSVLLLGETGTGKEVVARRIHGCSGRTGELIALNCAALPGPLLESELFGHERGAFSGARERKAGLFELAQGGTLFLDEIGELPLGLQVKLLRALEERVVFRLGGAKPIRLEFRLIAATHRDLRARVREGAFREDLLYRLEVLTLELPPLRERGGDALLLFGHFLEEMARELGRATPAVEPGVETLVTRYAWPGNVRELRNVVERLLVLMPEGAALPIAASALPCELREPPDANETRLAARIATIEEQEIVKALALTGQEKAAAARLLGISRPTLDKKLREHGIVVDKR